jgi:DNA-binding PadR family transcriptional regulator
MNDLILLALLLDGPKHGYQLKREAGFLHGQGDMHNNLVYPLLRRFLTAGWISKKAVPGQRGQTRQQYSLTAAGKKVLISRLSTYNELDASSFEGFITRVGMFAILQPEIRERILEQRQAYLRSRAERLGALGQKLDLGIYGGEVVDHLQQHIQSELAWVRRLRRLAADRTTHEGDSAGKEQRP